MKKTIKKGLKKNITAILLCVPFFATNALGFEYSYLPPIPKNYVKSYVFAFDFSVLNNSNSSRGLDYSIGISSRKIVNFLSNSDYEYYSKWNTGLKGGVYYDDYDQQKFLQIGLGPTLGYNFTNHLNFYISVGGKTFINIDNNNNNDNSNDIVFGLYGESGIEYFVNDDIDWYISYEGVKLNDNFITDKQFRELRAGFKITFH